ncbi:MAG: hypothetical protein IPH32_04955 [Bacteroidetes bacterium]|nr:hypothetical protein [Bacteroidota bacterium]
MDDETETQDYGMRIYNPALGRFLSIDPLSYKYPYKTPYDFAENSPINSIDLIGLQKNIATDPLNPDLVIDMSTSESITLSLENHMISATKKNWTDIQPVIKSTVGHDQYIKQSGKTYECKDAADLTLQNNGYMNRGYERTKNQRKGTIQTYSKSEYSIKVMSYSKALAINLINRSLESNKPVMVGLIIGGEAGSPADGNADQTSNHYVVIVGRIKIDNKYYFRYYDNASSNNNLNMSTDNLIEMETLTQYRKNPLMADDIPLTKILVTQVRESFKFKKSVIQPKPTSTTTTNGTVQ